MANTDMTGRFTKLTLASIFTFLIGGGVLADNNVWTGGAGDGKWTTAANWSPEKYSPTEVSFPAGQDCTVYVPDDVSHSYISIELPEGSGTVTLTGPGSLSYSGIGYIKVGAGRELRIDGIMLTFKDCYENGALDGTLRLVSGKIEPYSPDSSPVIFGGDAKVIVEGGTFGRSSDTLIFTNNATITVKGGLARVKRWRFYSPDPPRESITRARLLGGVFHVNENFAYTTKIFAGAHIENLGGTLMVGLGDSFEYNRLSSSRDGYSQGDSFAEYLPSVGGKLVIPTSTPLNNSYRGALDFYVAGDYHAGGSIYVTNNTDKAGVVDFNGDVVLRGGSSIYANGAVVVAKSQSASYYDLYLTRLCLGNYGFRRVGSGNNYDLPVRFWDGIVFGAWGGDVPMSLVGAGVTNYRIEPYGPVVYDTEDCFAPGTTRVINMGGVRLGGATELKATGAGTAVLAAATGKEEFRTLEVADGTTLVFTNDTSQTAMAGLKAMNLKLGDGATLKIDLSLGDYVDAAATASFGDGAKIVVTALPASLTAGTLYPIYFAPAGTDPDLSKIEYALGAWPTGWSLAKTGNAVYLTDGNATAVSASKGKGDWMRYWSGAGSDGFYATAGNWVSNDVANTKNHLAYFNGCLNTDISLANSLEVAMFQFGSDSGPFMFRGEETAMFYYPLEWGNLNRTPSIHAYGKFPAVISNRVGGNVAIRVTAYGEGPIALVGGGGVKVGGGWCPLGFGGDIRLGGSWTSDYVRVMARSKSDNTATLAKRNSRLTVMPGGTFATLNQVGDVNEYGEGTFAVATGATATIDGTDLTFTSNNTHYVDGALVVNCPLVPTARQSFRGDGTLTLAGGVSAAPAGGVRIEGSLTLVPVNWENDVVLSAKDNATIAPTGNWTLGGEASLDLDDHSTLTLATGGHKLTFETPIVSEGTLAVTGSGELRIAAAGMSLGRVTCAGGAKITLAGALAADGFVDVLTVREDDESIAFGDGFKVAKRKDDLTGRTVYSVKKRRGAVVIFK